MTHSPPELSWTIPLAGETIANKYVIEAPCGRGGLAVVLSAIHSSLDRRVAIKMLLPEWAGYPEIVERFLREGRAATRIKSEHVVRVFDVGTLDSGAPYLVLEYLDGQNLDDVVTTWGPMPVPTAIDWVLQAAEAIAEAHAYGIVHRDLKPSNLFLTKRADGSACIKVIDFGLSKLTDPRMNDANRRLTRPTDVMGSPHYMAPEQLRATRDADARVDLWALGAVLHELITGQPPFRADTVPELCATVLTQPAPPLSSLRPNVPAAVEQAVLRCLEKDPRTRFATIAEVARAVAPHGTAIARASCERIERVLEGDPSPSGISLLPPLPENPTTESWPSGEQYEGRVTTPASAKVVVGSVFMLAGLGLGALMWMHAVVHANDPKDVAVTASPRTTTTTVVATATSTASTTPNAAPTSTAGTTPSSTAIATVTPSAPEPAEPPSGPAVPAVTTPRAVVAAPAKAPPRSRPTAPSPARSPESASIQRAPRDVLVSPSPAPLHENPFAPRADDRPSATSPPSADDLFQGRK
jgi:serine/threonine-protein kinase